MEKKYKSLCDSLIYISENPHMLSNPLYLRETLLCPLNNIQRELNQIKYKNLILKNQIFSPGNLVDGRISNRKTYSQIAQSKIKPRRTFAVQNNNFQYTNPNVFNLPKRNNTLIFCLKKK